MNENNRVDEMIKIKENNEGRNDEWIRTISKDGRAARFLKKRQIYQRI